MDSFKVIIAFLLFFRLSVTSLADDIDHLYEGKTAKVEFAFKTNDSDLNKIAASKTDFDDITFSVNFKFGKKCNISNVYIAKIFKAFMDKWISNSKLKNLTLEEFEKIASNNTLPSFEIEMCPVSNVEVIKAVVKYLRNIPSRKNGTNGNELAFRILGIVIMVKQRLGVEDFGTYNREIGLFDNINLLYNNFIANSSLAKIDVFGKGVTIKSQILALENALMNET
ncbi:hypothetical protein MHBO_000272, partial [Bonamia ostreae]